MRGAGTASLPAGGTTPQREKKHAPFANPPDSPKQLAQPQREKDSPFFLPTPLFNNRRS